MKFAIKSKSSVFWKSSFTHEAIQEKYLGNPEVNDLMICPLGEAEKAIPLKDYLDRPSLLKPEKVREESAVDPVGQGASLRVFDTYTFT